MAAGAALVAVVEDNPNPPKPGADAAGCCVVPNPPKLGADVAGCCVFPNPPKLGVDVAGCCVFPNPLKVVVGAVEAGVALLAPKPKPPNYNMPIKCQ